MHEEPLSMGEGRRANSPPATDMDPVRGADERPPQAVGFLSSAGGAMEESALRVCDDPRRAHPALDPWMERNHPDLFRSIERLCRRIREGDEAYAQFLRRLLHPSGAPESSLDADQVTAAYYLNEAQRYLEALVALFPRRRRARLHPDAKVAAERDLRALMGVMVDTADERRAFEARRLLYVALLFLNVERTWEVQRGSLHRDFFAGLLERELFHHTVRVQGLDLAFDIAADGIGIDYHDGPARPGEEVWRFYVHELKFPQDGRPKSLHVYFYSCRSKREVLPYRYVRGQQVYRLETRERWGDLTLRRDASIVSKMLRKGSTRPCEVQDIVGAMFIVKDIEEVETLKETLFDILGGPMRVRNVVDTLSREEDRDLLNRHSGAGYKVFKADAEVLFQPEWRAAEPYVFTVELQLYTLETYLRTIHTRHYASHHRLKQRQFLEGLAPLLFPAEIYHAPAAPASLFLPGTAPVPTLDA